MLSYLRSKCVGKMEWLKGKVRKVMEESTRSETHKLTMTKFNEEDPDSAH